MERDHHHASSHQGQSRYSSDEERRAARRDMWTQWAQTAAGTGHGERPLPRGDAP
jgi:hypothetical protein